MKLLYTPFLPNTCRNVAFSCSPVCSKHTAQHTAAQHTACQLRQQAQQHHNTPQHTTPAYRAQTCGTQFALLLAVHHAHLKTRDITYLRLYLLVHPVMCLPMHLPTSHFTQAIQTPRHDVQAGNLISRKPGLPTPTEPKNTQYSSAHRCCHHACCVHCQPKESVIRPQGLPLLQRCSGVQVGTKPCQVLQHTHIHTNGCTLCLCLNTWGVLSSTFLVSTHTTQTAGLMVLLRRLRKPAGVCTAHTPCSDTLSKSPVRPQYSPQCGPALTCVSPSSSAVRPR
jgi:hypothetical protein